MKNTLTQEQVEKLKKCKTIEEAKEFAKIENLELSDEDLENTVGGGIAFLVAIISKIRGRYGGLLVK